jgi:hypothetical protein
MTGKNPNVFFEVGYAKAINKKIILLTQTTEDIPFDLKHYPHIVYGGKIVELKKSLSKSLKHYLAKPDLSSEELQLGIDLTINGILLTPNDETIIPTHTGTHDLRLSIKNRTNTLIKGNKLQIGVIGEYLWAFWPEFHAKRVFLSEDESMYLYTQQNDIFPQGWDSLKLLDISSHFEASAILRVFTENGSFDLRFKEKKN